MVFAVVTVMVVIVMTLTKVRVWRARARGRGRGRLLSRSSSIDGVGSSMWGSRPGTPDSIERFKLEGIVGVKSA